MADVRSNLAEVTRAIRDVAGCLNMNAVGRHGRVGEDALDIIAEGIYDRAVLGQREPGGGPLAKLSPFTLEDKARHGYPSTIGVRTGHMLAMDQLKGERAISSGAASVEYGRDAEAKERMDWFTRGRRRGRRRQPPRPVFELDDRIEEDLDDFVDEVVDNAIRRNGGA
jgi:hypothetical protein